MTAIPIDPRIRARRVEVLKRQGRRRLRVLLVVGVVLAMAMVLWWLVERSPLLDVDQVTVSGAEKTPVVAVVQASGIDKGEPLLQVDVAAARAAIADLPWVQRVSSDRTLGGEVRFTVTERVAVAAVPGASGWLLVDSDGRVLETTDELSGDVVVVDGARWQVAPGGWVGEGALPALDVAALLPAGLRPKVASIQVMAAEGSGDLELVLFGGGRVLLGDAGELDQKFLAALTLLVRLDIDCLDTIDVRAPSVPVLTRLAECS